MSKAQTKTATTAHGTVEYETVECDSCGNETPKETASRFVMIHDLRGTSTWIHDGGYKEFEARDYAEGWACQYCHDSPASFPERSKVSRIWQKIHQNPIAALITAWITILAIAMVL